MPGPVLTFRAAEPDEAEGLARLVRIAYRGDESRAGWTTEADLLADDRIDTRRMIDKITDPDGAVLVVQDATGETIACCELLRRGAGLAYFGMFAVRPTLQGAGVGRAVLRQAEAFATEWWGATRVEMTVIAQRHELIAWYERRGYAVTGERREFPYEQLVNGPAKRDDLYFVVLARDLPSGMR